MANIDNVQLPDGSSYNIVDNTSGFATQNYVDSAVSSVTKTTIGLGNVDNTSDLNKPISTATQTALDAKVNKSGDTMSGNLVINRQDGTTSSVGYSRLDLGNNKGEGADKNSKGAILLYGQRTGASFQFYDSGLLTGDRVLYPPDNSGVIALANDVALGGTHLAMAYEASITDVNNCPAGFYSANTFTTNTPSGSLETLLVLSLRMNNDPAYCKQIAWSMSSPSKIYTRQCFGGNWGAWTEIPTGIGIEKVSVTGTVQTDGVIPLLSDSQGDVIGVSVNSPELFCPSVLHLNTYYYATLRHYSSNQLLVSQPVNLTVYYVKK